MTSTISSPYDPARKDRTRGTVGAVSRQFIFICLMCVGAVRAFAQANEYGPGPAPCQGTPGNILSAQANGVCGDSGATKGNLTALTARAPRGADDSTVPYPVGASWGLGANLFQTQDVTAGFAMWQQIQSSALPLDVIGLYVSAATVNVGGSGFAVGDTITLTGGAVLKVATIGGSAVATVTVTTPNMFACAPTNPVAQITTSGSGTGATFNLTLLKPTGYGTRLLTKCYTGNAMTISRSDTGETKAISFLSDGSLDASTLDGFSAGSAPMATYATYSTGVTPRISTWNDQGGGGNDATQTVAAIRPTISPLRSLGNARSVMFDSHGQANSWDPANTYLNLPSGVSVAGNNNTIAVLAGTENAAFKNPAYISLGCMTGSCYVFGIDKGVFNTGFQYNNGGSASGGNPAAVIPFDGPILAVGVSGSAAVTFDAGNASTTWSSGHAGISLSVSGGTLGEAANNQATSGLVDESLVVVVPWAISSTQRLAFEASVYKTFSVPPQYSAVVVAVGDSHMDGWGSPFQQSWPRQMLSLLGRQDVNLVNAAAAGAQLSALVATSSWNVNVLPTLSASNSTHKFVLLQGCYNDLGAGQTVAQCETSYTTGISLSHASGAKAVCVTDVIRNGSLTINNNMQSIGAWLRSGSAGCDAVIDLQSYSVFNQASGPWSTPWFEQQDSGLHMTAAANGLVAAMAANVMAPLLP